MSDSELIAKLERSARYWLSRYRQLHGVIESGELVSEGWLAYQRSGTWIRAEGAMRDKLRSLARNERNRSELYENLNPASASLFLPAPVLRIVHPSELVMVYHRSRQHQPSDLARAKRVIRGRLQGKRLLEIAAEENRSDDRIWAISHRAVRRIEGARIAERRRVHGMGKLDGRRMAAAAKWWRRW